MAARRLVLNGLTAEVAGPPRVPPPAPPPASPEFYHELELYRQLLALPAPPAPPAPTAPTAPPAARVARRARTPDPPASRRHRDEPARRCRTPAPAPAPAPASASAPAPAPAPASRPARYLGSFPAAGGEHAARVDAVSRRLHLMKESGCAVPVLVVVALSGVRVCDPDDQSVRMSHALRRISYATCEAARALFAFVAREPRAAARQYCHAFETDTPDQAEELNALVGDAFRMAFASQLQPSAPLWSKELSGGPCARAPDSLPGLAHHYPRRLDRSPTRCDIMGGSKLDACEASEASEASPSSSEEWNSPTELSCYRRLGERLERMERPPLMKRLALGFSGALLQPSDDDATPLVTDTPTTPTNVPLCLNGGYINEASEAEARTRESNRELQLSRMDTLPCDLDMEFRKCSNISNGSSSSRAAGSGAASSSSGASSCGASRASGNNNRPEPELKSAPWFQQGIPREIALEVLGAQAPGAFLVRGSTTQAGCLALSLRVPRDFAPLGIAHYLILRTPKGYKIKGFTKEFCSLSALVTHHSVMPELLPVPLRLPRAPLRPRADLEPLDRVAPQPHQPHQPQPHAAHPHQNGYRPQLDV